MEYILQTDNLSKVYGTKTVLNHVSIHVPKKSIYGLVGKNGAEKTTLMRIICAIFLCCLACNLKIIIKYWKWSVCKTQGKRKHANFLWE